MIVRNTALALLLVCLAACACNCNKAANPTATQPVASAHPASTGIPTDIGIDSKSNGWDY
jgi:hypothetical protein